MSINKYIQGLEQEVEKYIVCDFKEIGILSDTAKGKRLSKELSLYNKDIGLYKIIDKNTNELIYIGKAIELSNGGFRKRIRDYTRESNSGRKSSSSKYIYEHATELVVHLKIIKRKNLNTTLEEFTRFISTIEALEIFYDSPKFNIN